MSDSMIPHGGEQQSVCSIDRDFNIHYIVSFDRLEAINVTKLYQYKVILKYRLSQLTCLEKVQLKFFYGLVLRIFT